jgi:amino acid permease
LVINGRSFGVTKRTWPQLLAKVSSPPSRPSSFSRRPRERVSKREIGALDLTALGIGAIIGTGIFVIIGTGIFVIIGEAIGESGPALVISFVLAGLTCISASRYRYHPATAGRSTFLRSSL